ncbi:MAG TPA: hypothetical protein VFY15_02125, partial [Acidimicrobiia bacterium]|nr:hypothetical protein [Acidimicrobiia bacterium]
MTLGRKSAKPTSTAIVAPVNSRSGDTAPVEEHTTTRRATRRPQGSMTVLAATEEPRIRTEVLRFTTTAGNEFWDVTDLVREVVARSGVHHGQVTIHTPHTTTTIVLNES